MDGLWDADAAVEIDKSGPRTVCPPLDLGHGALHCTDDVTHNQNQNQEHLGREPLPSDGFVEQASPERRLRANKLRLARLSHLDDSTKAKVSRSVQTAHVKDWLHTHGYVVKADKLHPAVTRIIAEWFQLVDEDNSKTIEHHELLAALKAAKIPCDDTTIKEMIEMMDMNKDGVIDWEEFEVFMTEEFAAGKSLLSGEYILPSGLSINFGVMIGKLKRNRLLGDIMHVSRRNKWAAIAGDPQALGRELATMQEAAEATSLTLEHLTRTQSSNLVAATPRTQLTAALLRASLENRQAMKSGETQRSIRAKLRSAALGQEILRYSEALERGTPSATPGRFFPDPTFSPPVQHRLNDEIEGVTTAFGDAIDPLMQFISCSLSGEFPELGGGNGAGGGAAFGAGLSRSTTPSAGLRGTGRGVTGPLRPSSSLSPVSQRPSSSSQVAPCNASVPMSGLAALLRERLVSPTTAPVPALAGLRALCGAASPTARPGAAARASNRWRKAVPAAADEAHQALRAATQTYKRPVPARRPYSPTVGHNTRPNPIVGHHFERSTSPAVCAGRPNAASPSAADNPHRTHAAAAGAAVTPQPHRHPAPRTISQVGLMAKELLANAARAPMETSGVPAAVLAAISPGASTSGATSSASGYCNRSGTKPEGLPGWAVETLASGTGSGTGPDMGTGAGTGPGSWPAPPSLLAAAAADKHGGTHVAPAVYDSRALPILAHPQQLSEFLDGALAAMRGPTKSRDTSPTPGSGRGTTGAGLASGDGALRQLMPVGPAGVMLLRPPTPPHPPAPVPRTSSGSGGSPRASWQAVPPSGAGSDVLHPWPSFSPGLPSYGCSLSPSEMQQPEGATSEHGPPFPSSAAPLMAAAASAAGAALTVAVAAAAAAPSDVPRRPCLTTLVSDLEGLPGLGLPAQAPVSRAIDPPAASRRDTERLPVRQVTAVQTARSGAASPVEFKRRRSTSHSGERPATPPRAPPAWGASVLSPASQVRLGPGLTWAAPGPPAHGYQSRAFARTPAMQVADLTGLQGVAAAPAGAGLTADRALRSTTSLTRIRSSQGPRAQAQSVAGPLGAMQPAGGSAAGAAAATTAVGDAREVRSSAGEHNPAMDNLAAVTSAALLEDVGGAASTAEGGRSEYRPHGPGAHHARQVEVINKTRHRLLTGSPKPVGAISSVANSPVSACQFPQTTSEGMDVLRVAAPPGAAARSGTKAALVAAAIGVDRRGAGDSGSNTTSCSGARSAKPPDLERPMSADLPPALPVPVPPSFGMPVSSDPQPSPSAQRCPRALSGHGHVRCSSASSGAASRTDRGMSRVASAAVSVMRTGSFPRQDWGAANGADIDVSFGTGNSPFWAESTCRSEGSAAPLPGACLSHISACGGQRPPSRVRTPLGGRIDKEDAGWSASAASLLQLRLLQQLTD